MAKAIGGDVYQPVRLNDDRPGTGSITAAELAASFASTLIAEATSAGAQTNWSTANAIAKDTVDSTFPSDAADAWAGETDAVEGEADYTCPTNADHAWAGDTAGDALGDTVGNAAYNAAGDAAVHAMGSKAASDAAGETASDTSVGVCSAQAAVELALAGSSKAAEESGGAHKYEAAGVVAAPVVAKAVAVSAPIVATAAIVAPAVVAAVVPWSTQSGRGSLEPVATQESGVLDSFGEDESFQVTKPSPGEASFLEPAYPDLAAGVPATRELVSVAGASLQMSFILRREKAKFRRKDQLGGKKGRLERRKARERLRAEPSERLRMTINLVSRSKPRPRPWLPDIPCPIELPPIRVPLRPAGKPAAQRPARTAYVPIAY